MSLRAVIASIVAATGVLATSGAVAVEGAMGRPISGTSIMPYAGVVPPQPGLVWSAGETYYDGGIDGSFEVPVGQNLALGIDIKASFTPISLLYIWDTGEGSWNFASGFSVPLAWLEAEATVTAGALTGRRKDSTQGVFDLVLLPIVASRHFSETEHLSLTLTVWANSGDYDPDELANLSMNTWTFIPGAAYTKLFPASNVELSASWAFTFDTENHATEYQNGILSDLEMLAVKRLKSGLGVGVIGSWIEQLTDDEGATADALDGFRGRAFGLGPVLTGALHLGGRELQWNARWVHEFRNRNYVEGDVLMLNFTL